MKPWSKPSDPNMPVNLDLKQPLYHQLRPYFNRPIYLAYSGGLDSQVLLHVLVRVRQQQPFDLTAIHIHHGLSVHADSWVNHCVYYCEKWAVACQVKEVACIEQGQGLEAAARQARYSAFAQILPQDAVLLTAHHGDDQAETLLLQLFRGAGSQGLAAMPFFKKLGNALLLRPFLTYGRTQLHAYAQQQGLTWVEDDGNQNLRFDRNFLRQKISPLLAQRWPQFMHTLGRAATLQAENAHLLQQLAQIDQASCQTQNPPCLAINGLLKLDTLRQKNLLRYWLSQQSFALPSHQQLAQVLKLLSAASDRQPQVHYAGVEIRRYRNALYAMNALPAKPSSSLVLPWQIDCVLSLPYGQLSAQKQQGQGLKWTNDAPLTVHFRQGGERIQHHGVSKKIKKLCQAQGIEPWLRPFLPCIYRHEQLLAVADWVIDERFCARENDSGWQLYWHK